MEEKVKVETMVEKAFCLATRAQNELPSSVETTVAKAEVELRVAAAREAAMVEKADMEEVETEAAKVEVRVAAAREAAMAAAAKVEEGAEVAGLTAVEKEMVVAATAVACILHRSRRSRSLRHMSRRGPSGLRRRRGCHGHIGTCWRTSTRSRPSTVCVAPRLA